MRTRIGMTIARKISIALLAAAALAGCSDGFHGFGGPKPAKPTVQIDPNLYPANYRQQIATMLATMLTDRAEYHGTFISPPALKPVPESQYQHYVVCLQFTAHSEQKTKMVLFLAGSPTQYVDATPAQCGGAAYQPFSELEAALPHR
jgi:hypothetical protein